MRQVGSVEVPQEAFMAVLKSRLIITEILKFLAFFTI